MTETGTALSLAAMFMIGLAGSGHCLGMCGGIATGLGFAAQKGRGPGLVIGYNLGRIASYAMAGAIVAGLGYWGSSYLALGPVLRIVAGVILVLMGLYVANWWPVLVYLEKAGTGLWKYIQPFGKRFIPAESMVQALALGVVWGWLPCGLVYTALAYAAASGHPGDGALSMVAFGLGTAPAMVASGAFSRSLSTFLRARVIRIVMAVALIGFGVWTIISSAAHLSHSADNDSTPSHVHHHH